MRISAICGSLSSRSANRLLLEGLCVRAPSGALVELRDEVSALPLFNPDLEAIGALPPRVDAFRRALRASDAVLIASPEYGHSLTGALKNAIDWTIGSGELERKHIAVTAVVPHEERGVRGVQALLQTLGAVSARIVAARPLVRGPSLERDADALLAELVGAASSAG